MSADPAAQGRTLRRVREDYIAALELALQRLRELAPDDPLVQKADSAFTAMQAENMGARMILGGSGDEA